LDVERDVLDLEVRERPGTDEGEMSYAEHGLAGFEPDRHLNREVLLRSVLWPPVRRILRVEWAVVQDRAEAL